MITRLFSSSLILPDANQYYIQHIFVKFCQLRKNRKRNLTAYILGRKIKNFWDKPSVSGNPNLFPTLIPIKQDDPEFYSSNLVLSLFFN